jgi:hypothetical protein
MNIVVRLRGENIDGGYVCCRGSQLARIVTALIDQLGDLTWYGADIEIYGVSNLSKGDLPRLIGNTNRFLKEIQTIDQFLRGVFLGVGGSNANPRFRENMDTEDPVDVDLGDAVVEIRAFDTTFFEIITRDKNLAATLVDNFGVSEVAT